MKKIVKAFLWRKANSSTLDTLLGESKGQFDIRFNRTNYSGFFKGVPKENLTSDGGFEIKVPIESFDGPVKVDSKEIIVRAMGQKTQRKDSYIKSQRPDTAYDLWREKRGFASRGAVGSNDYIIIVRDSDNKFHARWIRTQDFQDLPDAMRENIKTADVGWCEL